MKLNKNSWHAEVYLNWVAEELPSNIYVYCRTYVLGLSVYFLVVLAALTVLGYLVPAMIGQLITGDLQINLTVKDWFDGIFPALGIYGTSIASMSAKNKFCGKIEWVDE